MDIGDGLIKQVAIKTLKNEKNLDDNNKVIDFFFAYVKILFVEYGGPDQ